MWRLTRFEKIFEHAIEQGGEMSIVTQTVIYGVLETFLEALAWGLIGYFLSRGLRISARSWYVDLPIVMLLFLGWQFWTSSYFTELQISFGNGAFLDFLGGDASDLFAMGWFDVAFSLVEVCLGYFAARWLLTNLSKRLVSQSVY